MLVSSYARVILGLIAILHLCYFGQAHAAKLYKWVDEQGVTHFGYAPPPTKERKNTSKIETLTTEGGNDDASSGRRYLSGDWYTKKSQRITRKLDLSYRDFEITDLYPGSYNLVRKKVASGKAEVKSGLLHLTYFEHIEAPEKLDTTEVFEITYHDDTRLELTDSQVKKWVYKKQDQKRSSAFFRELNGEWKDKRGTEYHFKHGTFTINPSNRTSTRRFGNLEWADPELTLDYVGDFVKPVNHSRGRTERWVLREKSTQQLTFVDAITGKIKVLHRKR